MEEKVSMGAQMVEAFVGGFTSGGTGLATGAVQLFDGMMKTSEGTLTGVAEVILTMGGVGLVIAFVVGILHKAAGKV